MTDVSKMFELTPEEWAKVNAQEDYESDIVALKGDYRGEVKDFKFIDTDTGGFYSLNAQITETVKGVKGDNRYVSRTFNLGDSEYPSGTVTAKENEEKILKALKTIGATSPEEAKGKTICLKVRPNTYRDGEKKGQVKMDKNDWPKHIVTIVKEFKGATDSANVADAGGQSKIPF